MNILDLFRPKWKHSDFRVRMAEIARLEDQLILAEIAGRDINPEVRIAAIEKFKNQQQLADVAMTDTQWKVRIAAVKKVVEQPLLARIACESQCEYTAEEAVLRLTDPQMLARVVKEVEHCQIAVKRIHDEALLLELLAMKWGKHAMAPYHIVQNGDFTDENLIFIWKTYPDRKRQAIERMRNPKALAEFALGSSEASDRLFAVKLIDDQTVLVDVARNDKDLAVRVAATSRLTDADLAKEISEDIESIVKHELGNKQWPNTWRSLEHGPLLISILNTASADSSSCPYFDSGVCMVRVIAHKNTSSGPERCTWVDRPHRECHVWTLYPR